MIREIAFFFLHIYSAIRGTRPPYGVRFDSDIPELPAGETVHIVGEAGHLWFAVLACPCGCGEIIQLSLVPTGRPRWRHTVHWNGTVSLHPSINRIRGCKSHFYIRRGRTCWCAPGQ